MRQTGDLKKLAKNVSDMAYRKNVSAETIANDTGIDEDELKKCLAGAKYPKKVTINKLAKYFNTNINDLTGDDSGKEAKQFGYRIKQRRLELGYPQVFVGNAVGVQAATVARWEAGEIKTLRYKTICDIAEVLSVDPVYLMGWGERPAPRAIEKYPIIADIAAGYDALSTPVQEWDGDTIDIPASYLHGRSPQSFFALRIKGQSMYPLYMDGDIVLVLKQSTLNNSGDLGVIAIDDTATIKRIEYRKGEDWLKLVPINPEYAPKTIKDEELEHCKVIGLPKILIRET